MNTRILHIASNTFREAVRDRVLYNLIAFALLMSGAAILVGQISIDIERLVVVNLGLTARVQGNGFVVAQDPPAGTALDTVGQCRLTLDRQRVARYDRAQP